MWRCHRIPDVMRRMSIHSTFMLEGYPKECRAARKDEDGEMLHRARLATPTQYAECGVRRGERRAPNLVLPVPALEDLAVLAVAPVNLLHLRGTGHGTTFIMLRAPRPAVAGGYGLKCFRLGLDGPPFLYPKEGWAAGTLIGARRGKGGAGCLRAGLPLSKRGGGVRAVAVWPKPLL